VPLSDRVRAAGEALSKRYARHERAYDMLFFAGGVTWDALTLARIDNIIDNALLILYLGLLAAAIVVDIRLRAGQAGGFMLRSRTWLRPLTRLVLGALFSAFVIFYARSVTWTAHSAFWILLVVGLIANEFLHHRLTSIPGLTTLYFFCSTTFLSFLIPIVTGVMSIWTFRAAIVGGWLASGLLLRYAHRMDAARKRWHLFAAAGVLLASGIGLDVAYQSNWIPPVPLAVRTGGIYNDVQREGTDFRLTYEIDRRGLFTPEYARILHWTPGDTVYCFTAVFAPTRLRKNLYHVWQRYHPEEDRWESTDRIGYTIAGGRDDGFRGTTYKRYVVPGRWRVIVETSDGKTLVRIPFEVVERAGNVDFPVRTLER